MRFSTWLIILTAAALLLTHPAALGAALTAAGWLLHSTAALIGLLAAALAWRLLRPHPLARWGR
ncbi:hypothetical protein [Phaeacidiphilus oryzae]|uniref:hypothetical protein n=1 Tax=Phaeacidiphilus oryzae TaxID=348818 RepID=UPI00055E99AC|nr:hypothetical protein [Phaeacidiphilus oryzae]